MSSSHPFCSVVIPTYERPAQLRSCLTSLARLDYPRDRFEVIVVDDGGRAPLRPIVELVRPDLEISLVAQANAGPAAARNVGAERARGELLAFTDDDCRPRREWLTRLAARSVEQPGDALGGRVCNGLADSPYAAAAQMIVDVGHGHPGAGRDFGRFFASNNLAVPADRFLAVGGFDPTFRTSEDRDFCARWVLHGFGLAFEPEAIVDHFHEMGVLEFARVHFGYGRGAFRHHRKQAPTVGRRVSISPSYYAALARYPLRHERGVRSLTLGGLLLVWHLANTAGFVYEWMRTRAAKDAGRARPTR